MDGLALWRAGRRGGRPDALRRNPRLDSIARCVYSAGMAKAQHAKRKGSWTSRFAVHGQVRLSDLDPRAAPGVRSREAAERQMPKLIGDLSEQQGVLYAEGRRAVLVVLQAMDTGGKDGTIRHVFGPLNPQGVRVTSFKVPTPDELAHDYLWRVHCAAPRRGMIGIFNRSHYEDVLVPRVHKLAPRNEIERRYDQINAFEKHLVENGTTILKFFLNISKAEQKERLEARLKRPEKHWKFSRGDLAERAHWDRYRAAYRAAMERCSTDWAPWHVIPADRKWYRNYAVARIVLATLRGMTLRYPEAEPGLDTIVIT
jgi:PPK2 family polyphosphate:nucleotide phosphotransferase